MTRGSWGYQQNFTADRADEDGTDADRPITPNILSVHGVFHGANDKDYIQRQKNIYNLIELEVLRACRRLSRPGRRGRR